MNTGPTVRAILLFENKPLPSSLRSTSIHECKPDRSVLEFIEARLFRPSPDDQPTVIRVMCRHCYLYC